MCSSYSSGEFHCLLTFRIHRTGIVTFAFFYSEWTPFKHAVSVYSIQQTFPAVWRLVSWLSKYLEICMFSIMLAKPAPMADTLSILALPSVRSLSLFRMAVCWCSPTCWSCSGDSQHFVGLLALGLLMNPPEVIWTMCAMHVMVFLNARHPIPEAWMVGCTSWVTQ